MKFELPFAKNKSSHAVEADDSIKKMEHSRTAHESSFGDEADQDGFNEHPVDSSATTQVADIILKIPALTWFYWAEKMTATTFGETFADFWSQTLVRNVLILTFAISHTKSNSRLICPP